MIPVLFLSFFLQGGNAQAHSSLCTAANCTLQYGWDGAERYASGWGAKANVGDYQVNSVCISSSAWTMIDNQNSNDYAQVGYLRLISWSANTTYYFYEYTNNGIDNNGPIVLAVDSKGWGSSDEFTTYYNSSTHDTEFLINSTVEDVLALNWSADDQQWSAEVHSSADYVVGGYNHHSLFGSDQYLYNGVWYTINTPSYMINSTTSGSYSASGGSFYTWDTRVP
jgi:hypothetical protein